MNAETLDFEEVETQEEIKEVQQDNSLIIAQKQINTGLETFSKKKAELELLAKNSSVTISGIDDKANIKLADENRKVLKAERVQLSKDGKLMRDQLSAVSKRIIEKERELIAIIEPMEKQLSEDLEKIEAEKEAIKQAEIAKEEARIQSRIDSLSSYGFQIDLADIKAMSDETFAKYLDAAKTQYEKELAEKEEAERLQKIKDEEERLAKEAEQKRLDAERKELEELRAKQAEAQRIIDEQNAKIAAEQKKIEDEKKAIEDARLKAIADKNRADELEAARKEAAEAARLKTIQDAKDAEAKRIEKELKDAELAKRKLARQPDKEKVKKYIADIKAIEIPAIKSEEAKLVMQSIQLLIDKLSTYADEKIETL